MTISPTKKAYPDGFEFNTVEAGYSSVKTAPFAFKAVQKHGLALDAPELQI